MCSIIDTALFKVFPSRLVLSIKLVILLTLNTDFLKLE